MINERLEREIGWLGSRPFWLACALLFVILAGSLGLRYWFLRQGDPGVVPTVGLSGPSVVSPGAVERFLVEVRDQRNGSAIRNEPVELVVSAPEQTLAELRTDEAGQALFELTIPEQDREFGQRLLARLPRRDRRAVSELVLERKLVAATAITTDKPRYQPGQTVHLRALSRKSDGTPVVGKEAVLQVLDPSGTAVYKHAASTSEFGIVSGDFALANEIRLGSYKARVTIGGSANELAFEVARYSLPKVSSSLRLERLGADPDARIRCVTSVEYVFGEPVFGAKVTLMDGARMLEVGLTDKQGTYRVDVDPKRLKGSDGVIVAKVELPGGLGSEATARLGSGGGLTLEAFPEAGELVPGSPNDVYIVTSDAEGAPRSANVSVGGGSPTKTSARGMLKVSVPALPESETVISATSADGSSSAAKLAVARRAGLLIRPERPVLHAGKPERVHVLGPNHAGASIALALFEGERPLATTGAELDAGKAEALLEIPRGVSGLVRLEALGFVDGKKLFEGQRLVVVEPAGTLNVRATLDRSSYAPGGKARLSLDVRPQSGTPSSFAVGVAAVDEAFFALAGVRPDLERRFFALERPLSSMGMPELPEPHASWLGPSEATLLDADDPKLDEARWAALAMLSASLPRDRAPRLHWDERRVSQALATTRQRLWGWAILVPMFLGGLCLAEFLGYGIARLLRAGALRGAEPAALAAWRRGTRSLIIASAVALFLPALFAIALRLLSVVAGSGALVAAWCVAAIAGVIWQMDAVRAVRSTEVSRSLPAFSRLVWLLPVGTMLLHLSFALGSLDDWKFLGASDLEPARFAYFVGFCGVLGILGVGVLSLVSEGALERVGRERGLWLLTRPLVVGTPLLLVAFGLGTLVWQPERYHVLLANGDLAVPSVSVVPPKSTPAPASPEPAPRVRRNFPETLFWVPELVTNAQGRVTTEIPIADSITTYRLAISAVGKQGEMGGTTLELPVRQPFFADMSLPPVMTVGDVVEVPVTVWNYAGSKQFVSLTFESDGFELQPRGKVGFELAPEQVHTVRVPVRAVTAGDPFLRVTATGTTGSDAVERKSHVEPNGARLVTTKSGSFRGSAQVALEVPERALAAGSRVVAKVYGGPLSQYVEALDGSLARPHGCFEQTSSTTYPNVLVLSYLKRTGTSSPEVEKKALAYLGEGYQRLSQFEQLGGGFGWFERSEPDVVLTAYGLIEFFDMQQVFPVDESLLSRTRAWLLQNQAEDGGWRRVQDSAKASDPRVTAYVAWALAEAGEKDPRVAKALDRVQADGSSDAYSLVLRAGALLAGGRAPAAKPVLDQLATAATRTGDLAYFAAGELEGLTHSRGQALTEELTALAAHAFRRSGEHRELGEAALRYLLSRRNERGTWASTPATVAVLRALVQASERADAPDQTVSISVAGTSAGELSLAKGKRDVLQELLLTRHVAPGRNGIELLATGNTNVDYQIVSTHYMPWQGVPGTASKGPLELGILYSPMSVRTGFTMTCHAQVLWRRDEPGHMGLVEIGVPPGFEVEVGDLDLLVEERKIGRYSVLPDRVIAYLSSFDPVTPTSLSFRLRALYPVRALAPASAAYLYYEPELRVEAPPALISAR